MNLYVPGSTNLPVTSGPATVRSLRSNQLSLSDATLCGTAVPANVHVTGSPTLTCTTLGIPAVAGAVALVVNGADRHVGERRRREGEESEGRRGGDPALHLTTSICSIIALSACSSAWQWNTYLPA